MLGVHLQQDAKAIREMQYRLSSNVKEVVRPKVLKSLDAGIISLFQNVNGLIQCMLFLRNLKSPIITNRILLE